MGKKLWGGVFSRETDGGLLEFNSSENIGVDGRLVPYDIEGSIAHVKMLKKQRIIPGPEADSIVEALEETLKEWKEGSFRLDPSLEDVHMNVETAVSRKTPFGKKMHTARSRNDQVNLDMRLYMRDELHSLVGSLGRMQDALLAQGKRPVAVPAHTHTRVAQPITSKIWGDAYAEAFSKDIGRLKELLGRINRNPLGACAINGTGWNIDRDYTAKLLGFDSVEKSSLETISSRGELESELAFCCSLIMIQLSRIAEDLIWFGYMGLVELPEEFCTGSSIMPNKMNPDALELVRGRSARVIGNLTALMALMKGTPTGHNADTQETKRLVMDSIDVTKASIGISARMIAGISWDAETGETLIRKGYGRATLLADKWAKGGMPFREAHEKVGALVKKLQKEGKHLENTGEL